MLFNCWASVTAGGPTVNQHWVNILYIFLCRYPPPPTLIRHQGDLLTYGQTQHDQTEEPMYTFTTDTKYFLFDTQTVNMT